MLLTYSMFVYRQKLTELERSWSRMERTEIKGKDVILHKDMSSEEREKEIERLRKESEALKEWEEE